MQHPETPASVTSPQLAVGATHNVYFPVFVPGANLSMGDASDLASNRFGLIE